MLSASAQVKVLLARGLNPLCLDFKFEVFGLPVIFGFTVSGTIELAYKVTKSVTLNISYKVHKCRLQEA